MKRLIATLALLAALGCSTAPRPLPAAPLPTNNITFIVENDNWQPLRLFIVRGGSTIYIARVPYLATTSLDIDARLLQGRYRVLLVPAVGSNRANSEAAPSRPLYGDRASYILDGRPLYATETLRLCVKEPLVLTRFCR